MTRVVRYRCWPEWTSSAEGLSKVPVEGRRCSGSRLLRTSGRHYGGIWELYVAHGDG